ncbi:glycosyl hydrolase family 28-related protein [Pseudomonas sp. NPDC089407]|uniref:glycosyl hydrolase family 28-related protein n=1 Tax=Pseudomonas sp. NPDC089407 TaxID=3364464 RepID=UPI00384E2C1D
MLNRRKMLKLSAIGSASLAAPAAYGASATSTASSEGLNNLDAVSGALLRQQLESPTGTELVGHRASITGVSRTLFEHLSDYRVSVKDFGALGNGAVDDIDAILKAVDFVRNRGFGGSIWYPAGTYVVSRPIPLDSLVHHEGAGRGACKVVAAPGSNTDVFKTRDFDSLTGVGSIANAPNAFSVKGLTIEGNYLDFSEGVTWKKSNRVINSAGSAIKIFGSRFDLDVEVYNVAKNALYIEGGGEFLSNQEHASRVRVTGRISGKEGIVFRGPGDIYLEYVVFGLAGLLPYSQRQTAMDNLSDIYPGVSVDGLVLDNSPPYTGHAEIGFVHVYANSYGFGVRTRGVNRFNVGHIVVENSCGGYYFGEGAHGVIGILESRANGRAPDAFAGSRFLVKPDIVVDNGKIWQLTGQMRVYRYRPSQDLHDYAVQILGGCNNLTITYAAQLQRDFVPLDAGFLKVAGSNNVIRFQALRVKGNGVFVSGETNQICGVIDTIYSGTALVRNGAKSFGNMIDIVAAGLTADSVGFQSVGVVANEKIKLVISGAAGFTPFKGDPMVALNRACDWEIAASQGNGINGTSTDDYIDVSIPNDSVSGSVVVPHNFLYAPEAGQVSLSLRYPGTPPDQLLTVGVRDDGENKPTATQIVISYRWSAIPTSGSANCIVRIR